jgi:hypothetical protein
MRIKTRRTIHTGARRASKHSPSRIRTFYINDR